MSEKIAYAENAGPGKQMSCVAPWESGKSGGLWVHWTGRLIIEGEAAGMPDIGGYPQAVPVGRDEEE